MKHWKLYKNAYIVQESFAMTVKSYQPPLPQFSTSVLLIREALRVCPACYRRQKEIMCLFPFSYLNSTDLNEVTACVIPSNVHIRALQHRTTELQRKLNTVSNELEQLQTKSKPTTKETFTQIDYLNWDDLQYYRDQISKLKARCAHNTTVINDIKKQLQDKNITLKDRNITISDLQRKLKEAKSQIEREQHQTQPLRTDNAIIRTPTAFYVRNGRLIPPPCPSYQPL